VRFFDDEDESEANEPEESNGELDTAESPDEISFGDDSLSGSRSEGSPRRSGPADVMSWLPELS